MRWPHALLPLLALCTCRGEAVSPPHLAARVTAVVVDSLPAPEPEAPTPAAQALPIEPLDAAGSASAGSIALARYGERTLAFVADADDRAIVTIDVGSRSTLASTPVGARPSAVLVTPGGRVAVLGTDDARVHLLVLAAIDGPLVAERTVAVPEEPVSAAMVPGRDALLVASRWGHALSLVPLGPRETPWTVDLPRDPAAVVASADGQWALVMHAAGSRVSVVALASHLVSTTSLDRRVQRQKTFAMMPTAMMMEPPQPDSLLDDEPQATTAPAPKVRRRVPFRPQFETVTLHADQAFAAVRTADGRMFAPEVFVDTGPAAPSGGYGASESAATPAVASFDAGAGTLEAPGGDRTFGTRCLLPRGVAFDQRNKTLLVACVGSDSVVMLGVTRGGLPLRGLVTVPKGPTGIALDEAGRRAVIWSAFDRVVSVLSLEGPAKVAGKVAVPRVAAALPEDVLRGRALFHAAFDGRIAQDGRACASCHPDGRDDGLTWSSPNGPMQTPMLFARLEGTAPYGWDGAAKDLVHHLAHTTARLGGGGLSKRDAADIGAYLKSLAPPGATGPEASAVARGAEVFRSGEAECSSCHRGDALTDGETHDVESGPSRVRPRPFDTPSLRFVSRSAPYFHDGRYATLSDMLAGSDGAMGHTSQLSAGDRAALEAYLRTL